MTFVNACCSYSWDAVPVRSQGGSFGKPTDLGWVASDILLRRSESNPIPCTPLRLLFHFSLCFTVDSEIGFLPRGPAAVTAFAASRAANPHVLPMQRRVTDCAAVNKILYWSSQFWITNSALSTMSERVSSWISCFLLMCLLKSLFTVITIYIHMCSFVFFKSLMVGKGFWLVGALAKSIQKHSRFICLVH